MNIGSLVVNNCLTPKLFKFTLATLLIIKLMRQGASCSTKGLTCGQAESQTGRGSFLAETPVLTTRSHPSSGLEGEQYSY